MEDYVVEQRLCDTTHFALQFYHRETIAAKTSAIREVGLIARFNSKERFKDMGLVLLNSNTQYR